MDRYAVIGNPVAHSLSPRIHASFAVQTGQEMEYKALFGRRDDFAGTVARFQNTGGKGLNVTLPFKREAFQLADELSARAARAGAVNTLVLREDGRRYGDNTDGIGLMRDLTENHGAVLADRKVLILGAGGAVRGLLEPLLCARPAEVVIVNRTVSRAADLCRGFADLGELSACGYAELYGKRFDLIIHATAMGIAGGLPPLPDDVLKPSGWCYDLFYAEGPTPFFAWAEDHGAAEALDGVGMLVEQAAESFFIWRGVRPETRSVIEALRVNRTG